MNPSSFLYVTLTVHSQASADPWKYENNSVLNRATHGCAEHGGRDDC